MLTYRHFPIAALFAACVLCLVCSDAFAHTWKNGEFMHPGTSDSVSEYGDTLGFMYGTASVIVSYKKPTITCLVSAYICNYSGGLDEWPDEINGVRFYFKPQSTVRGPGGYFQVQKTGGTEGFLDSYWKKNPLHPQYWWVDYHHHTFILRGNEPGDYNVESVSLLEAKYDLDGDGIREIESWTAEVTKTFWFRR